MRLTLEQAIGQMLMLAFAGTAPPPAFLALLQQRQVGGVTLFRGLNVENPAQVRDLTSRLQEAAVASGQPPLLIGADQEGGTLMALAETTPFPGNMALGAAGSLDLARRVGETIGHELAAMGVNVDYAPVCDVNVNPQNPVVGTRSFGEDPAAVAALAAALVEGLQAAGVAATAKHFPGHGDTTTDSHLTLPVVAHDAARLRQIELPPFAAAVRAGARLVMTSHLALPALTGGQAVPATLAPAILQGLLREELGFTGVIISDAMNMRAIRQGPDLPVDATAAVAAGVDLLLLGPNADDQEAVYAGLQQSAEGGLLAGPALQASAGRVLALKDWIGAQAQPPLDVVACAEHQALARAVADQAVTLVRDTAQRLPLRLDPTARIAAVVPRPADLTPADTSSYIMPALAVALRRYHPLVDEFLVPLNPDPAEVGVLHDQLRCYDLVIIGTINATTHEGQAALVNALLAAAVPTIAVALRLPYDLAAYPAAPTYLCTYSVLEPSLAALAAALWGAQPCRGRLPVSIPGLYPCGAAAAVA